MKSIIGKSILYYVDLVSHQMVNGWDLLLIELRPPASPPSAIYCNNNSMEYKSGNYFKASLFRINHLTPQIKQLVFKKKLFILNPSLDGSRNTF